MRPQAGSHRRPPGPVPGRCDPRSLRLPAPRTAAGRPPSGAPPPPRGAPAATIAPPAGCPAPVPAVLAMQPDRPRARPLQRTPGSRRHGHHRPAQVRRWPPAVPTHTRASS
ncbi:MAG: hypothetical protein E6I97_24540, partial [Chloroflexi bacterium]